MWSAGVWGSIHCMPTTRQQQLEAGLLNYTGQVCSTTQGRFAQLHRAVGSQLRSRFAQLHRAVGSSQLRSRLRRATIDKVSQIGWQSIIKVSLQLSRHVVQAYHQPGTGPTSQGTGPTARPRPHQPGYRPYQLGHRPHQPGYRPHAQSYHQPGYRPHAESPSCSTACWCGVRGCEGSSRRGMPPG